MAPACSHTHEALNKRMCAHLSRRFEPGAVVCRVSPSFVRFGTFQLPVSRGPEELGLVRMTADYVIRHHYPDIDAAHPEGE